MKLSIVTTLYRSEDHLEQFVTRASAAARLLVGNDFEIVLVNDGSPDASLEIALRLARTRPGLLIVDLSRNFGHHKAMMTGLSYTSGEQVFLIDSDLEEQPEWLTDFDATHRQAGVDVVFGVQRSRRGGLFERVTGRLFYRLFRAMTGIDQPDDIVTARLMSRRYVDALVMHRERELNIGGLWIVTGFEQVPFVVEKLRLRNTSYTLRRKFGHLVTAITSFSSLPLVWTFYVGLLTSFSAAFFIAYLIGRYFFVSQPPEGYTSIVASMWLFFGIIILLLGVQGIYISRIFSEVKQRPYTIVRSVARPASFSAPETPL